MLKNIKAHVNKSEGFFVPKPDPLTDFKACVAVGYGCEATAGMVWMDQALDFGMDSNGTRCYQNGSELNWSPNLLLFCSSGEKNPDLESPNIQ